MQKIFYTSLLCLAFYFNKAQTVYIAETGKKYHTKSCPEVKNHGKAMDLKEAKKKGYTACVSCGADKIVEKDTKTIEKKKEEKE